MLVAAHSSQGVFLRSLGLVDEALDIYGKALDISNSGVFGDNPDAAMRVMKIGLARCGGALARGFKVRVLRWRSLRCKAARREQSEISEHSDHSEGLADARSFSRCGRCVSGAGLMAAICLPGEVRRPVPGCYLPGGALGGAVGGRGRHEAGE